MQTPPRSMKTYKGAILVVPDNRTYSGSIARLYELAWRQGNPRNLFHPLSVARDASPSKAELPENPTVLRWGKKPALLRTFGLSSMLVRDEYPSLLCDIIDDAVREKRSGTNIGDDNGAIGVGADVQAFPNPFVDFPQSGYNTLGAVVTGTHGIGKTVFLIYVLALRLLARQTTVFQINNAKVYVLNDEGVFSISPIEQDDNLQLYTPRATWFLVDSNEELIGVPPIYPELCYYCGGFILQAASPRNQRVKWTRKVIGRVPIFWMAPWSLGELIAGRDLHVRGESPSESDLADFSQLYGTATRRVYAHAANPRGYAIGVDLAVGTLSLIREKFAELLGRAVCLEMEDDISYEILVATPSPGNRKKFDLQISTAYLSYMVLDQLAKITEQAADMLYQLFIRNPYTRAAAGHLLEGAFLAKFPNGGEWPMTALKHSPKAGEKGTYWHSNGLSPPRRYLRLGYRGRTVAIANDRVDLPVEEFDRLDRYYFSQGDRLKLQNGFYIPRNKSQPTLDAFVYDEGPRHATVFQVTSFDRYGIPAGGLDWLHKCGAKSIDLIVVTPPLRDDIVEDMQVANSHRDKLCNVYHLELHDLKECTAVELKKAYGVLSAADGRISAAGSTDRGETRGDQSRGPDDQWTDTSEPDMVLPMTAARSGEPKKFAAAVDNGEVDTPDGRPSRQHGVSPSSKKSRSKRKRGPTGTTGGGIDSSAGPSSGISQEPPAKQVKTRKSVSCVSTSAAGGRSSGGRVTPRTEGRQ